MDQQLLRAAHDLTEIRRLVENGADVNIVTEVGTPLASAVRRGHLPAVKYFVEHGADVNIGTWIDSPLY
jgi:ankyrin repeat protein